MNIIISFRFPRQSKAKSQQCDWSVALVDKHNYDKNNTSIEISDRPGHMLSPHPLRVMVQGKTNKQKNIRCFDSIGTVIKHIV